MDIQIGIEPDQGIKIGIKPNQAQGLKIGIEPRYKDWHKAKVWRLV